MNTANWTEEEAQSALGNIMKRATTDPDFRRLVLNNPAAAVLEVTGKPLPDGFVINVVENEGADLTVVLPDAPVDSELSESELAGVAGGGQKCGAGTCGGSENCGATNPCGAVSMVAPCLISKAFTN